MAVVVTCPACRAELRFQNELEGKDVKCPRCAAPVHVAGVREGIEADVPEVLPAEPMRLCPYCRKRKPANAGRCPHCGRWHDDEDDEDVTAVAYKPCPRCGTFGAERVVWTAWGSFYGPRLFHHVRCPQCGYKYNGKTGRSNRVPATIFVLVPLLGILAILGGLVLFILKMQRQWP
jgi:hypothetical protein